MSALAPIVQAGTGSWIGWAGIPGAPPKAFDHGGMRLTPIGLNAREIEGFYEGFANRTLWPLYHDAVRPPEFRREWWQSYVEHQRALRRADRDASPRRARPSGCTTTSCTSCRRCCARCAPICASASSCTSRCRRRSCSCSCRGASRSSRACSAPTSSASSARSRRRTSCRSARRLVDVHARARPDPVPGAHRPGGRVPGLDRLRRDRRHRGAARDGARRQGAAGGARLAARILLGVDRLDYTKGIDVRLQAFRELLESGVTTRRRDGARAGRDAEPRARRRPTASCASASSARSAASTASSGASATPRSTTSTTTCPTRRPRARSTPLPM